MGKLKDRFLSHDESRKRKATRKIRDSVFTKLFSNRENALELYRFLNPDDTTVRLKDIKIVTIRNIIENGVFNDLGFTVRGDQLYLIEAQSTKCPAMPFRMDEYFQKILSRIARRYNKRKYSPTEGYTIVNPHFYTVYTGKGKVPEVYDSAAFFRGPPSSVSYSVTVLTNETAGYILKQYCMFADVYDDMRATVEDPDEAVVKTIRYCIENNILRDFFLENEAEVINIMKEINEQEVIYNEMVKELNRNAKTIAKKDSENKKLRKMLLETGMSKEAIALGLST